MIRIYEYVKIVWIKKYIYQNLYNILNMISYKKKHFRVKHTKSEKDCCRKVIIISNCLLLLSHFTNLYGLIQFYYSKHIF